MIRTRSLLYVTTIFSFCFLTNSALNAQENSNIVLEEGVSITHGIEVSDGLAFGALADLSQSEEERVFLANYLGLDMSNDDELQVLEEFAVMLSAAREKILTDVRDGRESTLCSLDLYSRNKRDLASELDNLDVEYVQIRESAYDEMRNQISEEKKSILDKGVSAAKKGMKVVSVPASVAYADDAAGPDYISDRIVENISAECLSYSSGINE